ncbi:uncharacterized protein ATNIH1004_006226 [Aspergillus tanneri]|uniref:Uncharacterized protein n=1 Tax=Aspergillus tanneri TaxID=1220188 RepID=A0A5M9MRF0_9EURO|nr:uncharacterized protein ATNIH1004_006226 [Aspergillus tanneri]KAA8647533.1 hypothetical protein ATNIH1004_006226 [Aspergillus tanneri]
MVEISRLTIFLVFAIANFNIKCAALDSPNRGFCATWPPNKSLKAEHKRLSALEFRDESSAGSESREVVTPIEIATWFHILLGSEDDAEQVSDEMIATQVGILASFEQPIFVLYN